MNFKRLAIFGIAALSLFVAVFVGRVLTTPAPAPVAQAPSAPDPTQLTELLVTTKDIFPGDRLTPDTIRWIPWPKTNIPEGAYRRDQTPNAINTLDKSLARVAMVKGDTVTFSRIIEEGQSGFIASILNPGRQAFGITLPNAAAGAGGFILPNTHVDVIATPKRQNPDFPEPVRILLRDIRVLAVNQATTAPQDGTAIIGKTTTLELTPTQIRILSAAQITNHISLALRSNADRGTGAILEEPEHEEIAMPEETPGERPSIEIIRYGQIARAR